MGMFLVQLRIAARPSNPATQELSPVACRVIERVDAEIYTRQFELVGGSLSNSYASFED